MKKAERHQKGRKALAVVTDNFVALPFDESVGALEDMLQCARLVDRKPRPHQGEQHNEKQKYQKLHRHRVWDGRLRILRLNVERSQQSRDWAGEKVIQKFGKPELFVHNTLLASSSGS